MLPGVNALHLQTLQLNGTATGTTGRMIGHAKAFWRRVMQLQGHAPAWQQS